MSYQILNSGMQYWFAPDGNGVVGYTVSAGYRVVAGGPICASEQLAAVAAAFEADAQRQRQRVCYFGGQERLATALDAQGPLARLLLGAQPCWVPQDWDKRVRTKASLRAQIARARNKHVSVTLWPSEQATQHPSLKRCLHEWLQTRGLPPMHFLVEPQTLGNLLDRAVFVAERAHEVVGFLVASPIRLRQGWLIEQIVRGNTAPNGTTELLLDSAMRHLAYSGAGYVTLGLAPLSTRAGIAQWPQPPLIQLLLALVRVYGQHFYNFDGLDAFKAKFAPDAWEPVYALVRARHMPIGALYAIASAFSGMALPLFLLRALLRRCR